MFIQLFKTVFLQHIVSYRIISYNYKRDANVILPVLFLPLGRIISPGSGIFYYYYQALVKCVFVHVCWRNNVCDPVIKSWRRVCVCVAKLTASNV